MSISGKITRFNMHELPPYERMQHLRARRMEAAAIAEKQAGFASRFADRFYLMEHGKILSHFPVSEMERRMGELHDVLGV